MTTLLLVEDNRGDARLFAELLAEVPHGQFALTTVETLADALVAAPLHDVVFLDLSLPDAHGLSTLTAMVAAARAIPIVVLTGNDDDRIAVDAVKAGAQDYLRKAEITPSLIARTAWYAIERQKAVENAARLARSDESARRARFISRVTATISGSLDLGAVLGDTAQLLVPTLGEHCAIDVLQDGNRFERVAETPGSAEQLELLEAGRDVAISAVRSRGIAFGGRVLAAPLVARGRVVGTLSFVVGAQRELHDDLGPLLEEVAERIALGIDNAQLYEAAQSAIRGRDELIAVVSHDLRNPLNVVTLALQMIEQDPDMLSASLPRAKRGVDRMQRLIADLLDVARIETGTLTVELRPVEIGTILDDTYELHRSLAAERNITLVRTYEAPVGVAVADRHRLGQALANLVGNALKFTPKGGTIRLGAECRGDALAIVVSDNGPGIAQSHLSQIFDRYWQPERGREGVGLGLAIVKGIVDAHGGKVVVESTPGAGATFRIELAVTEAAALLTGERPALAQSGQ